VVVTFKRERKIPTVAVAMPEADQAGETKMIEAEAAA